MNQLAWKFLFLFVVFFCISLGTTLFLTFLNCNCFRVRFSEFDSHQNKELCKIYHRNLYQQTIQDDPNELDYLIKNSEWGCENNPEILKEFVHSHGAGSVEDVMYIPEEKVCRSTTTITCFWHMWFGIGLEILILEFAVALMIVVGVSYLTPPPPPSRRIQ